MNLVPYVGWDPEEELQTSLSTLAGQLSKKRWAGKTAEERSAFGRARAQQQWKKRRAKRRIVELLTEVKLKAQHISLSKVK